MISVGERESWSRVAGGIIRDAPPSNKTISASGHGRTGTMRRAVLAP